MSVYQAFTLIDIRATNGNPRGLCTLEDAHLWDGETPEDTELAIAYCQNCPIKQACLTNALNEEGGAHRHHRGGIRGGLTTDQRAAMWRRMHRKAA